MVLGGWRSEVRWQPPATPHQPPATLHHPPDPGGDVDNLLIFGASVRAAAFSALRAGMRPWCADLFADADLRGRCPAMQLPGRYPLDFLKLIDSEVPGP